MLKWTQCRFYLQICTQVPLCYVSFHICDLYSLETAKMHSWHTMFSSNLELFFSGYSLDVRLTIQKEVRWEKELPFKWSNIANFTWGILGASSCSQSFQGHYWKYSCTEKEKVGGKVPHFLLPLFFIIFFPFLFLARRKRKTLTNGGKEKKKVLIWWSLPKIKFLRSVLAACKV